MASIKRMIKKPCLRPSDKGLCIEWSRKCMAVVMKTVLFTGSMITQEDDVLQLRQEKITKLWLNWFLQGRVSMPADSFSCSSTRKRPVSSFWIIPPQIIIIIIPLCWRGTPTAQSITTVENPSFSWAIRAIWRRSGPVNEENSFHVRHHAFSRPFSAQIFVPLQPSFV
mgnify:FL=1